MHTHVSLCTPGGQRITYGRESVLPYIGPRGQAQVVRLGLYLLRSHPGPYTYMLSVCKFLTSQGVPENGVTPLSLSSGKTMGFVTDCL